MALTKAAPAAGKKVSKTKAADKKAPAKEKLPARVMDDEQTRRENAIADIKCAAEHAALTKTRMGLFIERLNARIQRACDRVEALVDKERTRQAAALEKYPQLKQLSNGKKDLETAAALPDLKLSEKDLPAYITNIKLETE
jgi:hypothetical protein